MKHLSKVILTSLLLPVVAGCAGSGGSGSSLGVAASAPATAPAQDTMSTLAVGTALTMNAHQGVEALTITNGAEVNAGTASFPKGTLEANPTGTYTKTGNGFTLTLPSGRAVTYITDPGSPQFTCPTCTRSLVATESLGSPNTVEIQLTNNAASNLTYSTYGTWMEKNLNGVPIMYGTFATGVATTTAQMPMTGTATYSGNIDGVAVTGQHSGKIESGAVSLNANFANNAITGSITNIVTRESSTAAAGTMNNINLTGGTISGASFSGIATAAAATVSPTVDITGAAGTFGGKFFGPNAAEALGSLSMTGTGAVNVLAAFGTTKN